MTLSLKIQSCDSEKHSANVSAVLATESGVLSGCDNGILKFWSADLKLQQEVDTGHGAILSMASSNDAIFTCHSDETIQIWGKIDLTNKGQIETSLYGPLKLFFEPKSNILWAGDSQGRVAKIENGKEINKFELTEEIWDLYVSSDPVLIFTARDRDILVSEIVTGQLRSNAVVKATMEGRYPLAKVGDYICCLSRDGRSIQVHEYNIASKFKLVRAFAAAEVILNALCAGEGNTVYAGGYDNTVSLWELNSGEKLGSVELGSCVNALSYSGNQLYVALTDGRIVVLEV